MRTLFILAFVVVTGTGGEIGLTYAMKRIGEARQFSPLAILRFVRRALGESWLWVSVGLMAVSFYSFLIMLSWYPVGFVVPATSLAYVAGAFGAKFLLGEHLSSTRWAGIVFICLGVGLAWADHAPAMPDASLLHLLARDAVFAFVAASLLFYLFGAWAAWRFFGGVRHASARAGTLTPLVSILKPVRGLDRRAYENFASFCRQDYPEYEILFAVSDEDDPAVPVIRRLMRDCAKPSIRLLIGVENQGANDKVAKLCRLAREARHDLLVISDSDVLVAPDYLRGVAELLADPRVGAVTALYRAAEAPSLGAAMDAVGSSASFTGSVLVARALEGLRFAMGSTMATTRQRLEEIGGFEGMLNLHSDDYELGRRIAAQGYRIELAPQPVSMQFPSETMGDHLRHELRWLVGIRNNRPAGHFGMLLTHGLPWAVVAAVMAPRGVIAAAWLGAYLVVRLGSGYVIGVWGLGDSVVRRKLWLLPLYDFLTFFIWLASFSINRIEWRGAFFTLEHGRMVRVAADPDPAPMSASSLRHVLPRE
jgi:ceramide glucosyltransferase